jgi:hypothetical protein
MAWQAQMQGKDPKEDNRLAKEGYGRFWWKEELNGTAWDWDMEALRNPS